MQGPRKRIVIISIGLSQMMMLFAVALHIFFSSRFFGTFTLLSFSISANGHGRSMI